MGRCPLRYVFLSQIEASNKDAVRMQGQTFARDVPTGCCKTNIKGGASLAQSKLCLDGFDTMPQRPSPKVCLPHRTRRALSRRRVCRYKGRLNAMDHCSIAPERHVPQKLAKVLGPGPFRQGVQRPDGHPRAWAQRTGDPLRRSPGRVRTEEHESS